MNDYIKAALYQHPDKLPISVNFLPATWQRYGERLKEIQSRHPSIFGQVSAQDEVKYFTPPSYHAGKFTDAWGCEWENIKEGYESIVTGHPLKEREDIHTLKAPTVDMGFPHGFMFLRLTDLRGFEEAMIDFFEEPPELQQLIDIVCDYNVDQAKKLVAREKRDVYFFGDDNGIQHSLPINPVTWRKYLKPAYKRIYDVIHEAGALVYMHTDGCIWPVIPDMKEAGVNILNPQIRANGLDHLVDTCKGKLCINLDLDRQLFPFATPEEVEKHIWECTSALYLPEGGLMLTAECAADVPIENIEAICQTMERCADYKG